MSFAVVALDFDPVLRFDDSAVRLETIAVACAVLVVLLLTALLARRVDGRVDGDSDPNDQLRVDDLVLIALAVVPGAVIGGRIGYALLHLDYYAANPGAFLDPQQGSLELMFAVLGGAALGSYAARLIGEDDATWRDVAAVPMLLGVALGKLAMALGGRGQGSASDLSWATAYLGSGPWASLAPAVPSHPSQVYEALGALVVAAVIVVFLAARRRSPRQNGDAFLAAVAGLAIVRAIVAVTWRDSPVLGPIVAEQLLCLVTVVGCAALVVWRRRRRALEGPGRAASPTQPGRYG